MSVWEHITKDRDTFRRGNKPQSEGGEFHEKHPWTPHLILWHLPHRCSHYKRNNSWWIWAIDNLVYWTWCETYNCVAVTFWNAATRKALRPTNGENPDKSVPIGSCVDACGSSASIWTIFSTVCSVSAILNLVFFPPSTGGVYLFALFRRRVLLRGIAGKQVATSSPSPLNKGKW